MSDEWIEVLTRLDEQASARLTALAEELLREQEKKKYKTPCLFAEA